MWYVQAQGDTFIRHIFDVEPTQWDAENYCYARRLTDEQVAHFGVHKKQIVTPPYHDAATQHLEEGPALLIDGVWTQNYIVTDLDADAAVVKVGAQWNVIRAERNKLLIASDWTQLPDTSADAAT
jgi:lysozyme family protein